MQQTITILKETSRDDNANHRNGDYIDIQCDTEFYEIILERPTRIEVTRDTVTFEFAHAARKIEVQLLDMQVKNEPGSTYKGSGDAIVKQYNREDGLTLVEVFMGEGQPGKLILPPETYGEGSFRLRDVSAKGLGMPTPQRLRSVAG